MSTVAFIPVRGGSKGIPKKNIKPIAGKPLLAWSIEQARSSELVDRIIVSTDDAEIAKCAIEYGAEVPFIRPADISGDSASTESAMLHCCDWLVQQGAKFDNFLLIQATSPVRAAGRFDEAIRFFEAGSFDSLVAVTSSHRFFWNNIEDPAASYDYMHRPRRQDLDQAQLQYMETGSFYLTKMDKLMWSKSRLCGRVGLFITPEEEAYEIDSLVDFTVCESILLNHEAFVK
ncbi:acylneuraminate cytidylyltransferase family protein [Pseudomonas guariconensis]|uniref:acylneuraminate cytidylyltransferase family protein n=1 Tax=Pseudomonas guariconensis TaxID=1288410 RepID=UPI002B056298|nr:acylneuraminate cytidylyltransferase family protein [Pseudomonas guariconensis]